MSVLTRWRAKLKARKAALATAQAQVKEAAAAVDRAKKVIKRHTGTAVPAAINGWHPNAIKHPYTSAGAFTVGKPKLVWHTTEGMSLPTYNGSAPHFTLHPQTGRLWQHIPITEAAKALVHPPACETNRAHAIQVELIGFAGDTQNWSRAAYANIAKLARFIEKNAGVKRTCSVRFSRSATRLSPTAWLAYEGHCGHEHVPGNEHWDPGSFRIDLVLGAS